MVNPGQMVSQTLKAEFGEEAMAKLDASPEERQRIAKEVDHLFHTGTEVKIDACRFPSTIKANDDLCISPSDWFI